MKSDILIKFFEERKDLEMIENLKDMFIFLWKFFVLYFLIIYYLCYFGIGLIHELYLIIKSKLIKK